MKELKIDTIERALDVVEEYYPRGRILPKTQYIILECLAEIQNEQQGPT
jgi:hypothetical protein